MDLSHEQIEEIAKNVASKLITQRKNRVVSNEEHNEHHLFIKQFKEKVELDDKAKRTLIQSGKVWALLVFLGFTGKAIWVYLFPVIEKGAGQ